MIKVLYDFMLSTIIGLLTWFFGGIDGVMKVLLAFVIVDYVTGTIAAKKNHELSSAVGFWGITTKVLIFALIGVVHLVDVHLLGDTSALKTAVCLFYIGNEGISILENLDKAHVPFPAKLRESFTSMRKQTKENTLTNKKKDNHEAKNDK